MLVVVDDRLRFPPRFAVEAYTMGVSLVGTRGALAFSLRPLGVAAGSRVRGGGADGSSSLADGG